MIIWSLADMSYWSVKSHEVIRAVVSEVGVEFYIL